jgi:hypothetical protein
MQRLAPTKSLEVQGLHTAAVPSGSADTRAPADGSIRQWDDRAAQPEDALEILREIGRLLVSVIVVKIMGLGTLRSGHSLMPGC